MRLLFSLLASSLLLLVTPSLGDTSCISTVDPSVDYFPDKVVPTESKGWTVTYEKTYKIVTNLAANTSYLLYQCGSTPPTTTDGQYTAVVSIPLDSFAVEQTISLPYLQQLGELEHIAVFLTDEKYISSPCFLEQVKGGTVGFVVTGADSTTTNTTAASTDSVEILATKVAFVSPFMDDAMVKVPVIVSENTEKTNAAIFEWIKYYSVFFNLEKQANQVFQDAENLYECVADNAAVVQSDKTDKPVVLWAYYSSYCSGWDVAKCPNYYCEFASSCSVDILDGTGKTYSIEACGGTKFMSTDELIAFGKDADEWIFPAPNWEETYTEFSSQLSQIKAVQNKKVYDYQGAGANAWFEERYAAYYDVLRDFCRVVGTTDTVGQEWFRNVFTESVGTPGQCTANGDSTLLNRNFECEATTGATAAGGGATTPQGSPTATTPEKPTQTSAAAVSIHTVVATVSACFMTLFAL